MKATTNNQHDVHTQYNFLKSLPSIEFTLCIDVTKNTTGWCVDISSLSPCTSLTDSAREDLLEESAILCSEAKSTMFEEYDDALEHIASLFAQYGSSVLGEHVSPPDLGLIDRLLERTNRLAIQSIETEVYSTFIDVGIATGTQEEPADTTAIYDIFSDTWHSD